MCSVLTLGLAALWPSPAQLYAGIPVSDPAALAWYEKLFGAPPPFVASDTEAVWDLAEHRSVSIEHRPEHAGHVRHTIFVDDVDALVVQIADRGVQPTGT
jgi:hypothetical protein